MSNLCLKKNPFMSIWLSTATRMTGSLRDQATAQTKRRPKAVVAATNLKSVSSVTHAAALIATALVLSACSKSPPEPSAPMMTPAQNTAVPTTAGASDPSVPDAASVLTPALATKADPAGVRSNNAMSRTQESNAMPMPGQNNDHSAPLSPAKRASAP